MYINPINSLEISEIPREDKQYPIINVFFLADLPTLPANGDYLTIAPTPEDTSNLSAGLSMTSHLLAHLFNYWDLLPAFSPKRPWNYGLDFATVPSYDDDQDSHARRSFARKV